MSSPAPIVVSRVSLRPAKCIPASSGSNCRRSPTAPASRAENCGIDAATRRTPMSYCLAAMLNLLLGATAVGQAFAAGDAALPSRADPRLFGVAQEARQTIAVIDWFYVQHRACPQPSRPAELEALQDGLGDGFSVDLQGRFVAIRGISMSSVWLYYT